MFIKNLVFAKTSFYESFVSFLDFLSEANLDISPFMFGVFIAIVLILVSALVEAAGKKYNQRLVGKIFQSLAIAFQLLIGFYISCNAFFLLELPLSQWPLEIAYFSYVFVKILFVLILALFAFIILGGGAFYLISWLKKDKRKEVKLVYKYVYVCIKLVLAFGSVAWGIVVTQPSLYYRGISGSYLVPIVIVTITTVIILLILPSKVEDGKSFEKREKKRLAKLNKKSARK